MVLRLKDYEVLPKDKKKNDCQPDNKAVIAEYPETMFCEVGNECLDSDDGNDKCYNISGYQHHHIVVIKDLRGFPVCIPKAFGKGACQCGNGKEKREFCRQFPGQLLLHPANDGRCTAAKAGEYNCKKLEKTNNE